MTTPEAPQSVQVDESPMTIPGVELCKTGVWGLSTGLAEFTAADFANAVRAAAECPDVANPPVKIGHNSPLGDGAPRLGSVTNLTVSDDGQTLLGDLTGVPAWLAAAMTSAYPNRSIEANRNYMCQSAHEHGFVITALALLGVTLPGVGTLSSIDDVKNMLAASRRAVAASRGETMNADDVIASAVERGAISPGRAVVWQQWAEQGGDLDVIARMPGVPETIAAASGRYKRKPARNRRGESTHDLFLPNPLVHNLQRRRPALVRAAMNEADPPMLFDDDDYPAITASGLDPSVLASLAWPIRRAVAAAPTIAAAYSIIDRFAPDPGQAFGDREIMAHNTAYIDATREWLAGPGAQSAEAPWVHAEAGGPADEMLHTEMFRRVEWDDDSPRDDYDKLFGDIP